MQLGASYTRASGGRTAESDGLIGLGHPPDGVDSVMRPEGSCQRVTGLPSADVANVGRRY